MTRGQIAQLQELSKCWMRPTESIFVRRELGFSGLGSNWLHMDKISKAKLRRLTHQYRHQIKAMKRNRKPNSPALGSKDGESPK
jgi:hypothetical protein